MARWTFEKGVMPSGMTISSGFSMTGISMMPSKRDFATRCALKPSSMMSLHRFLGSPGKPSGQGFDLLISSSNLPLYGGSTMDESICVDRLEPLKKNPAALFRPGC